MTLPGRYNVGGFGSYFSSSYHTNNYNKSSSFSQDLKNRGYFLTLTTLNRSSRYHNLPTSENASDGKNDSKSREVTTELTEPLSKLTNHSSQSTSVSSADSNEDVETEEREVR